MIYDCFMFYNELDLLDLRMRVLGPVVDYHVLVEATTTVQGKPKPLVFAENKHRFAQKPIIHVVVDDLPQPPKTGNAMPVEYVQRNAIMRGLVDAKPDDRIMVSDVDEIPHPDAVARYGKMRGLIGFPLTLYYYYVNCRQQQLWWGTVMASRFTGLTPQQMRNWHATCPIRAAERGWHFSFLGGVERIRDKLAAFSESQVNTPENSDPAHLQRCLETGADMFHRKDDFAQKEFVPLDASYPACIEEWIADYPYAYKEVPCATSTSS